MLTSSAIDCLTQPVQTARQRVPCPHAHSTAQFPPGGPPATVDGRRNRPSSGVWSGNEASVIPTSQMRAECCPVLLGLGGLVSLDSLLYDFRTMLNLAFSDASIGCGTASDVSPCCGISSILGCWPSSLLFSLSAAGRRGGAVENHRGSWDLLRDSAFSPEGESRAVVQWCSGASDGEVQAATRLDRLQYFQGCRAIWKSSFRPASTLPGTEMLHGNAPRIQNPDSTGGRDSVLHWPGPQREDPFCAAGLYECICWIRRKRSQLAAAHLSFIFDDLGEGEARRGEAMRPRPRIPPLCPCLDRDQAILAPAPASSQGR
jgi:hypothetical protein